MKKNKYEKYHKKEGCSYSFTPEPLGYCWGYALNIDGKKSKKEIEKYCKGCEYREKKLARR